MRIVCTVTNDLSHDQRMHRICGSLQAAGHAVTLIGRELPGSPPLPERPYRQLRLHCRYHRGKRFYAEFNARLIRKLREQDFDLLYSVDLDTLLAAYLSRRRKTKWIYDAHEWFSETPEVYPRPLIRAAWRRLGRWLVPRTDIRITVGPALARELATDYRVSFTVIRNTPQSKNKSNKEIAEGVILYQGMLNPGRGLETAIEAMAYLRDEKLWIVGDGPERARLERLADTLQVADRVWFAGFWPPDRLPELTSKAWLGLNLLVADSPSYYYSLANKSLDYIQAELPSVQMDFPEYRAIQEEFGCFVLLAELSSAALVRQIDELKADPALYSRLKDNCHRAAQRLNWEVEAARLLALIEDLV